MYSYTGVQQLDDHFLSKAKRPARTVFMTYLSGYDELSLEFLSHYYYESRKAGVYIRTTMSNPVESEVRYLYQVLGDAFSIDQDWLAGRLRLWEPKLSAGQQKTVSQAVMAKLVQLEQAGNSGQILKNAYVKFMCWFRYKFESLLYQLERDQIPRVLYEGSIGKYELYFLQILAMCGCDVVVADLMGTGALEKLERPGKQFRMFLCREAGQPALHFTKMDWSRKEEEMRLEEQYTRLDRVLKTNQWAMGEPLDDLFAPPSGRGDTRYIYNLFGQFYGSEQPERELYENQLYFLKTKLDRSGKPLVLVQGRLEAPAPEEVNRVIKRPAKDTRELVHGLSAQIRLSGDETLNMLAKRSFTQLLLSEPGSPEHLGRVQNKGVMLLCWLHRYGGTLFSGSWQERMPVFLFYGAYHTNEALFFRLLAGMPVDVLIFCPDLTAELSMRDARLKTWSYAHSVPAGPFPEKEQKVRAATTAYQAERELDTMLYQDTGLFRPNQFLKSSPVTLKTTYEEIGIYWKQEAKYRPYFEAGDQRVRVPVIFAKVSGVKDGNVKAYWQEIESRLTENTLLITRLPRLRDTDTNPVKSHVTSFFRDGKLLVDRIQNHGSYQYDYLSEKVQNYILDKIQELVELNWICDTGQGVVYTILSVLLNLDRNAVRLIQKFDFTAEIPKLIMVSTKEETGSLEDAIYTAFLNLVGFDIIIYAPTGYRTIEKYLKADIMEEHQAGTFLFDLTVPRMKVPAGRGQSIFSKLFREG